MQDGVTTTKVEALVGQGLDKYRSTAAVYRVRTGRSPALGAIPARALLPSLAGLTRPLRCLQDEAPQSAICFPDVVAHAMQSLHTRALAGCMLQHRGLTQQQSHGRSTWTGRQ